MFSAPLLSSLGPEARAQARMILRPQAADAGGARPAHSPGLAFACGTLKDGGALRQGSVGRRGGGRGVSSLGTSSEWLVSGASSPCGILRGGMLLACMYGCGLLQLFSRVM